MKLFLLDAYALIYRSYYAFINSPRINSKGLNTSAIMGFCNTLNEILKKENPTHIAVAFDPKGGSFRNEKYPEYKAQREATPEDIRKSVPEIKRILEAMNIQILEVQGFEADDVIGAYATFAGKEGYETFMLTPDKDYGQLVSKNVKMYRPRHGGGYDVMGPEEVCTKYGIDNPLQVIDLLGLMGDSADNIPGCPGVGEKTAVKLINEFGSIENLLSSTENVKGKLREKIEQNREQILMSKDLATICTELPTLLPISNFEKKEINESELEEIFNELEFKNLLAKFFPSKKSSATKKAKVEKKDDNNPSLFELFTWNGKEEEKNGHNNELSFDEDSAISLINKELRNAFLSDIKMSKICNLEKILPILQYKDSILEFKEVLEDENIEKVGINLKDAYKKFYKEGILIEGPLFDTTIAQYIIQPEIRPRTNLNIEKLVDTRNSLLEELKEKEAESLFREIEMPLVYVLAKMEINGVCIDIEELMESERKFNNQLAELEKEIHQLADEDFNISSPKQVGEILFSKLKISEKAKKTKTGQYVTSEEVLNSLKSKHPIVEKILNYRGLKKLVGTYIEALPKLINKETGHIHTTFNQTITATGRLSSSDPNLQNIPIRSEEGKEIRKAFIPEEGCEFFSADYSQIELRIMAHLSEDENMIEAFNSGQDIHAATAAKIYKKPIEDVTKEERRKAKSANFGIIYGISAWGLAEGLGIERKEAKSLIEGYFESFPKVKEFIDNQIAHVKECGYAETMFKRRRYLPDINSQNGTVRAFAERNAINAPIQGTAADIIKLAMVRVYERMKKENLLSKLILQVHDELNFSVVSREKEQLEKIVIEEMQSAAKLRVPLIADSGWGKNWLEAH